LSQLSHLTNNKNSISHIHNEHNQNNGATGSGNSASATNSNGNTNSGVNSSSNGGTYNNGNQHNSENNNNHSFNNNNNEDGDDNENDDNSSSSHSLPYSAKQKQNQRVFSTGQKDILRLIGQHLRYLGLNKTTELLVNESGCMLEHPTAANFCGLIMNGKWDEVKKLIYFIIIYFYQIISTPLHIGIV
jgi:hypothetical protein